MSELSIFIDESGDFGAPSNHAPYFLVALVLHEQDASISAQASRFNRSLANSGLSHYAPVHTAPLIRREEGYKNLEGETRKKIFDALFAFSRRCAIKHKVVAVNKRQFGGGESLQRRVARELDSFTRENLGYFQSFDHVILYYDNGQKQLVRALEESFGKILTNVEFRTVNPSDYLLFQVADLACTMELVESRRRERGLTKSESSFFGGAASFKKTYLKAFRQQDF